jgi:hypothetical protein
MLSLEMVFWVVVVLDGADRCAALLEGRISGLISVCKIPQGKFYKLFPPHWPIPTKVLS